MLTENPSDRIGIGEIWSVIDSFNSNRVNDTFESQRPLVFRATTNPNNIIPVPEAKINNAFSPQPDCRRPPVVPRQDLT